MAGFNDLTTTAPEIAAEWDYEKNGELMPDMVTKGSNKNVWWKCAQGHSWQARISHRIKSVKCPECRKQLHVYKGSPNVVAGQNDLQTTDPKTASEWAYDLNGDITPKMVTRGCNKVMWWRCSKGHKWQNKVNKQVKATGCPYCEGSRTIEGENDLQTLLPDTGQSISWNSYPTYMLTCRKSIRNFKVSLARLVSIR